MQTALLNTKLENQKNSKQNTVEKKHLDFSLQQLLSNQVFESLLLDKTNLKHLLEYTQSLNNPQLLSHLEKINIELEKTRDITTTLNQEPFLTFVVNNQDMTSILEKDSAIDITNQQEEETLIETSKYFFFCKNKIYIF